MAKFDRNLYERNRYANDGLHRERVAIAHKRRTYKLAPGEYESMLESQHGVCGICCGLPPRGRLLSVDHDHKTGVVRGLLCDDCNHGIGRFRDDPRLMATAIAYLEKHGQ